MNNIQRYEADFKSLVELGQRIYSDLLRSSREGKDAAQRAMLRLSADYQRWYTESLYILEQLLPKRLAEFQQLYEGDRRRRAIETTNYSIQDWLRGLGIGTGEGLTNFSIAAMRFGTQLNILKSVEVRFDSSLCDIRQLVQADLFDSELDAARELKGRGFLRAGGAVAGVVLEKHLGQVLENHGIRTRKKSPTINDFNELLKCSEVLDIPSWRQIQRLGDIRNLCDHNKEREPTREEVEELIDGAEKYLKTLF